jgi:hypothetical protein
MQEHILAPAFVFIVIGFCRKALMNEHYFFTILLLHDLPAPSWIISI